MTDYIKNAHKIIQDATYHMLELCQGAKWRQCVPVQPDDSDEIFDNVIVLAQQGLQLREAIQKLVAKAPQYEPKIDFNNGHSGDIADDAFARGEWCMAQDLQKLLDESTKP